jgi:tRNA A37 threonylcarbamoyladenosine synthetase subunit TsaC/SUA5/YrdC
MRCRIDPDRPSPSKLRPAVEAVQRGEVIIYPTDTGYAFGCAIWSAKGIRTLRRLKGVHEKSWKPLAMLVRTFNDIGRYGQMDPDASPTQGSP